MVISLGYVVERGDWEFIALCCEPGHSVHANELKTVRSLDVACGPRWLRRGPLPMSPQVRPPGHMLTTLSEWYARCRHGDITSSLALLVRPLEEHATLPSARRSSVLRVDALTWVSRSIRIEIKITKTR